MNYGSLIRDAWSITWWHRSLWVLGLFATSTVGSCSNAGGGSSGYRVGSGGAGRWSGRVTGAGLEFTQRLAKNQSSLGTTLLTWLIDLGLSIGAAIAALVALIVLAIPPLVLGFALYAATGIGVLTIAYVALAVLVAIAAMWGLSAIANTYFWAYWTIAYLRLTRQLAAG